MRRLLPSVFLLLLVACYPLSIASGAARPSDSDWVKQKTGTFAWLRAVFFVDAARGWAVGGKGALLSTVDGGARWREQRLPGQDTLRDIFFTDARTGWIVCERSVYLLRTKEEPRSYLLRTADGGVNWSRVEIEGLDPDAALARVVFADAAHGWVTGEGGLLYATTDGGVSWTRQRTPTRRLLLGAHFYDARQGWIAGASSTILRTSDGGASWRAGRVVSSPTPTFTKAPTPSSAPRIASTSTQALTAPPAPSIRFNAVSFVDARQGWAVGESGAVYATTDGGATWRAQASNVEGELLDVKFFDAREGYASGDGGVILHTLDGGATWGVERTNTTHQLERLFFAGRGRGWAVGFGGTIIAKSGSQE